MASDIFLLRLKASSPHDWTKKHLKRLFQKAQIDKILSPNDLTAIKVHFGEKGNSTYLPARFIEPIVHFAKIAKTKPFVTDTNVLYRSQRDNAPDHLTLAYEHGFGMESLGAPVLIADGINGHNEVSIEINAPIHKKVFLAADFVSANSVIVVTHATGHLAVGMGATIKNMGMGMSSRKGKLMQHSISKPQVIAKDCTACGLCKKWCPADSIEIDQTAHIIESKCIGCGECLSVCRFGAVGFKWDATNEQLQQQIAEHALGIMKNKKDKIAFFTFLINMTKDCDCLKQKPEFVLEDIGVLAGFDPVAIDQAVLDLTKNAAGKDLGALSYPNIDTKAGLKYSEKIGLGSTEYNLIEI